jgi:putative chitinase
MPFDFDFTADQVAAILKDNEQSTDWYNALVEVLPDFEITSALRVAAFLSQTSHESANYTKLHENLNYKAASLIATWPKHFSTANAAQYEHQPELIANRAYANRNGNGDEDSGDGYKYRGRGPIQVTGKSNYAACGKAICNDENVLLNDPDLLENDMSMAIKSACWYWNTHKLNLYADNSDIDSLSDIINIGHKTAAVGDAIGYADRKNRFDEALQILQG